MSAEKTNRTSAARDLDATVSLAALQEALGKDFLPDETLRQMLKRGLDPVEVIKRARSNFAQAVRARSFGPVLGKWVLIDHPDGFWIWIKLGDSVSTAILRGSYDKAATRTVKSFLRPGGIFLDIGTNVGWYTMTASLFYRAKGGRVLSFEPQRSIYDQLVRSIEQNGFQDIATAHNFALGDRRCSIQMRDAGMNSGGSSVHTSERRENFEDAQMLRFDDLPAIEGPIDVIKLDIEGAEPMFFKGAKALFSETRPPIVCEVYPRKLRNVSGVNGRDFVRSVLDLGYEVSRIADHGLEPFDWATAEDESLSFNVLFSPR